MVKVPVRDELFGLLAAKNRTVPFPVPELPDVTESQEALLEAVQGQPAGAVTATDPLKPPDTAVIAPTLML